MTETDVLQNLAVRNAKAPKAIVYFGMEEVIAGWNSFYIDYANAIESSWPLNEEPFPDTWCKNNSFQILYDVDEKEVYAIRDFGRYQPKAEDFLFVTKFIPLNSRVPESKEDLKARILEIMNKLDAEIAEMKNNFEKPIFLIKDMLCNNYLGWSLVEEKYIYIHNYKAFRDDFFVAEDGKTEEFKKNNEYGYGIIPPSDYLIDELRLELSSYVWDGIMKWDEWEPRPEREEKDIDLKYEEIYSRCIALINRGRLNRHYINSAFVDLESRVERFENLLELGAPDDIIKKEIRLIKKAINEAESIIILDEVFCREH